MVIQVSNKCALIWELTSYNHLFKETLMNFVLKHLKKAMYTNKRQSNVSNTIITIECYL